MADVQQITRRKRESSESHEDATVFDSQKVQEVVEKVDKTLFKREVSRFSQVLLTISIITSFMYWTSFVLPLSPYLHMCVKWLSVATLTCIIFRFLSSKQDIFLFSALFFHGLGDLVLAHPYQDMLLYSMGPFLLGHFFYIMTFKSDIASLQLLRRNLSRAKKILLVSILTYGVVMGSILIPRFFSTPMFVPGIVYLCILFVMITSSVISEYTTRWITLGCCLYVLSDSLIALHQFYVPLAYPLTELSWPLYYIGQMMILFGFLKEKNKSKDYFLFSHRLLSF